MAVKNFPLEERGDPVSRDALVQAALTEITQNYREASLSNVARAYGVSLAYVSECVRAQTGKTYKELLQKHRMETAARLLRRSNEKGNRSGSAGGFIRLQSSPPYGRSSLQKRFLTHCLAD